jgi:hypothetical protein
MRSRRRASASDRQRQHREPEEPQAGLRCRDDGLSIERLGGPIPITDFAHDIHGFSADAPDRCREPSLREREQGCADCRRDRCRERGSVRGGARHDGKSTPRQRESDVGMHDRQLEPIRDDERRADRDEREKPGTEHRRGDNSESHRAYQSEHAQSEEDARRNPRAERPSLKLIERVRCDADREKEREKRAGDDSWIWHRSQCGA